MRSIPPASVSTVEHRPPPWPAVIGGLIGIAALAAFVRIEDQRALVLLIVTIAAGWFSAARFGLVRMVEASAGAHPWVLRVTIVIATIGAIVILHDDNFGLLMIATVLLYATVCLGLTVQMGYTGLSNFSAAAFFGTGAYTAAALSWVTWMPDVLTVFAGGLAAVLVGSMLILPVLRTRGHYAALTTLAFGIMFGVFLDANQTLGGPQGLKLTGLQLFGWDFSREPRLFGLEISFYANYVLFAGGLAGCAMIVTGRLDRSWIGLWLDSVRLDETASAVFGVNIGYWKGIAFTIGNFFAGAAGAVYAKMLGFIAPNNFTLGDSLLMVSIVILGGIGNRWGVFPATAIVVLLPEKLQFIQEYRLLLFAILVIAILMASPEGLMPRRMRQLQAGPRNG